MTPEDLQEMQRRLSQEHLLHAHDFAPALEGGRELWTRDDELYTRGRAIIEALQVLTTGERGQRERGRNLLRVAAHVRGYVERGKCGNAACKCPGSEQRFGLVLGGNVCGVFPSRRLLILEATVGRRRGMIFEELAAGEREGAR